MITDVKQWSVRHRVRAQHTVVGCPVLLGQPLMLSLCFVGGFGDERFNSGNGGNNEVKPWRFSLKALSYLCLI